jgi:hypothetical protein
MKIKKNIIIFFGLVYYFLKSKKKIKQKENIKYNNYLQKFYINFFLFLIFINLYIAFYEIKKKINCYYPDLVCYFFAYFKLMVKLKKNI